MNPLREDSSRFSPRTSRNTIQSARNNVRGVPNRSTYGGLNRRFQVLNQMIRLTGMPRWYIKRQAARLGLTPHMDRRPWTASEMNLLEKLVGPVSSATIAKRLHRPESSVVNIDLCIKNAII